MAHKILKLEINAKLLMLLALTKFSATFKTLAQLLHAFTNSCGSFMVVVAL